MSPSRSVVVSETCSSCGTDLAETDRFCDQCGSPVSSRASVRRGDEQAAPPLRGASPPARSEPDLGAVRQLVGHLSPVEVHTALRTRTAMCVRCGTDLPPDEHSEQACSSCGGATALPPAVPVGSGPGLGSLHPRRAFVRKKPAMLVAYGPAESTLLLHNGRLTTVVTAELPPVTEPAITVPALRSPVGRILRLAAAVDHGTVSLPWTGEQLLAQAFGLLSSMPWYATAAALDALELGRPDLVGRCGLPATEVMWLGLVTAARNRDYAGIVSAMAALPPGRYRRKIAIVAASLDHIRRVPGAAEALAPALAAFAESEPLAVVAQRALGLVTGSVQDRMDDLILRATAFRLPAEITRLSGVVSAAHAEPSTQAMLGARGRLAVLHNTGREHTGAVDLSTAPLAIVDDLIGAGVAVDLASTSAGRSAADQVYLTARLSPGELTAEQLVQLDHRDEQVRRELMTGTTEVTGANAECVLGRHAAMLDLLSRKRPQDVSMESVLPAHRATAKRLADMIVGTETGEPPSALLHEELLTDRTTWLPMVRLFGTETLRDAGTDLARRFAAFFEWLGLVAAREHLYLANWQRAIDAARSSLQLATAEAVRDEAQNLLACGLHNLGDHAGAMRELEQAIEGSYSVALLANIGVVAAHLDTELAADHLARIVREAPTAAMRLNAARRALVMWQSDKKIWRGTDGEDPALPTVLREPLRSIVADDIGLDDFRVIVAAMARLDAGWLTAPSSLRGSPHRKSLEARYYLAVAAEDGFMSAVDVLATVGDWSSAPEWLANERDNLAEQTIQYLLDHLNDPDSTAGVIAHALVTKVRGIALRVQIPLALLGVASLAYHVMEQGKELADGVVAVFRQHQRRIPELDAADREVPEQLVELCVRRIAISVQEARRHELAELIDPYNDALDVLARVQRGAPVWFQARNVVAMVVEACKRTEQDLRPWLRELVEPGVRKDLTEFLEECADFEAKAQRVLRS